MRGMVSTGWEFSKRECKRLRLIHPITRLGLDICHAEMPRWAKVLWFVAWSSRLMGILLASLNPSHVALTRVVRIYVLHWRSRWVLSSFQS